MQHAEREDEMRTLWQSLLSVRPRIFIVSAWSYSRLLQDLQRSVDGLQASPGISERIYTDIAEKVFGELQQVNNTIPKACQNQIILLGSACSSGNF
jgi:hypothetical protein